MLRKGHILTILVIGISVITIPVFAQIESDIDEKSLFNTIQYDVTAELTNHNGVPFYFKFDRSFTESKNDAYYELYKVIDSRNNQHVGDFRIYLGSSQWWDDNALLQEDDTSGYSNIIKTKLFVIHLTDPKKIDDVADSLSYALKVLVPEWSSETSPISSDEWFFDSINNAKRNNDDKRENKIIIENKEIRVLHDDIGFGSITLIVTENFDATKKNYVTEQNDLLDELLSSLEKEPEISEKEPEPEPECDVGSEYFNGICYRIGSDVDHTLTPYYEEDDAGSLRDSIRYFKQNWKFEKALELTEIAKKYSEQAIYPSILLEKSEILSKMSRHQEALDTFNEFDKRLASGYNIWNYQKGIILYNLGKYSSSANVLESTLVEIQEKESSDTQKKFLTGIAVFHLGMAYEKLGDVELANQAYSRASQDIVIRNLDCNKVRTLIGFGGYVEAMEILNNMDSEIICIAGSEEDTVQSLKELVQERISKYVLSSSTVKSSDSICGPGTILNEENQCVPARETMVSEMQQKSSNGGGCLIATATYGSELSPQVQQLRELRDNTLLKTESGSTFMTAFNQFYYSFSPTIADWERQNPFFKEVVNLTITPLITSLSLLNYADIDSEAEVLGYGVSLIILNIGMYFVAPAVLITKLKKLTVR